MTNCAFRFAALAALLPLLVACGTTSCDKPEPFQSASEGGALKVPADLSAPAPSGKFEIPQAESDRKVRGPCGDVPPLRRVVLPTTPAEGTAGAGAGAVADAAADAASGATAAAGGAAAAAGSAAAALPLPTTEVDVANAAVPQSDSDSQDLPGGPPPVTGGIDSDIRDTVIAWVKAWRAANGPLLLQFYADGFEPPVPGESRQAWEEKRVALLAQTGPADVRYDRLTVRETFVGANARFIQEFHNEGRIDALIKELDFVVEDGSWKIVRERVIEVL